MIEIHWNSPFGARPLSAALIRREDGVRRAQARLREDGACAGETSAEEGPDKWALLRALTEARARFGLSDRTIAVLEALVSCHAGKRIDPARPQIVFPSNRELSLRTRGMADATLRRHLASLIEAGLLLRRDSPNGKRYRRRDVEQGDEAFGFDLSPFALSADVIQAAAEAARAEARAIRHIKTDISLCRRDIRKILDAALSEGRAGDWTALEQRWIDIIRPLARNASVAELTARLRECADLRIQAETRYLSSLSEQEMSGNDARNERHYQNSKTESHTESSIEKRNEENPDGGLRSDKETGLDADPAPRAPTQSTGKTRSLSEAPAWKGRSLTSRSDAARLDEPDIATVLEICPSLSDYSTGPIRSPGELEAVADRVRGFLGISRDAYRSAQSAMGPFQAAVTIAALLERAEHIRSPGGYLRALTHKAATKGFRLGPMLEALRNHALRS
ncbi:plasmid replication protein RepC [Aureimonas ureilytica]|uniref:plasmid replication protein RepC n=1 Tax=Aureimonas ureilytica TaxID=401562 RepID=UPI0007346351|nr:plasmid replication protein RepC [Aureimonas ureilytica]